MTGLRKRSLKKRRKYSRQSEHGVHSGWGKCGPSIMAGRDARLGYRVFYEIAVSGEADYLVTGKLSHVPKENRIVN